MDNWQRALDNWLTSTPKEWDMERVTKEGFMDTDKESGVQYPTYIDELTCEDCGCGIGWESHGGTFVEFYADPSDTHYKCEDCHGEWADAGEGEDGEVCSRSECGEYAEGEDRNGLAVCVTCGADDWAKD